jgi:hypothetical protein
MSSSEIAPVDAIRRIVALLETAPKPLTFVKLKREVRLEDAELRSALEAAASQGVVFRWPDYRRSQYFWSRSPDNAAQQAVLAITTGEALSQTKLVERASKRIPGFSRQAMQRIVMNLIAGHELQQVPAFTTGKLLVRSGSSAAYAASARKFIEEKFRKAGLDPNQLLMPPRDTPAFERSGDETAPYGRGSATAADQILEAMRSLEPVAGVPVSAQRLRNHLPELNKRDLDAAALELRNEQRVFLSPHDSPHRLPQQERDILIDGGDGSYYVAIAIR